MNKLTIVLLFAVSTAFAEFHFHNFQVITSSCLPDLWKGVDLVWAMDASSSVGLKRYQSGIDFMKWATLAFKGHIGDGPTQSRMALFEFDETQYPCFELDTFKTAENISAYIDSLRNKDQNGTDNFFVKAIDFARSKLFNKALQTHEKVLVFVADGWTDETAEEIAAASKTARDEGIDIWFIGYETDISKVKALAVVGGKEDHVSYEDKFTDVNLWTKCNIPTTVPPTSPEDCHGHGIADCICPHGYFGPNCNETYDCTYKPIVVIDGKETHPHLCHDHGVCVPKDRIENGEGVHCKCNKCYTGRWCQDLIPNCVMSDRCILYDTKYTQSNSSAVQYMCGYETGKDNTQRCIPDNLDCGYSVHTTIINGRPVCQPDGPRQKCKCEYPIGWCIPLEIANNVMKTMAIKNGAYLDKFFTGSSL